MNITKAVYRPAYQDLTIYDEYHQDGVTRQVVSRGHAIELLALADPDATLEEDSGITAYGLLKSIGPLRGVQV